MPERTEYETKRAASLRFDSVKPGLAVPAVFWTTDAELRVTSVQGNGLEALGISTDDLIGAPIQESLVGTSGHDPILVAHRRALAGESTCFEARLGNSPVEIYVAPQIDANGDVCGVIGIAKLSRSGNRNVEQQLDEKNSSAGGNRAEAERLVMIEIIQALNLTSNLDELLQRMHGALKSVVSAENFFIALHDDATGMFHFPFVADPHDVPPAPRKAGR
ncbi:MAG TPA: PAS domain-containing protein, partial [Candidatus Acidoferrales bacterium]